MIVQVIVATAKNHSNQHGIAPTIPFFKVADISFDIFSLSFISSTKTTANINKLFLTI